MGRKPISKEEMKSIINDFFKAISYEVKTINQLASELGYSESKLAGCIKWFRRECELNPMLLPFYPIATNHGYKKLKDATEDEVAKAYCSMFKSTTSQQKTFSSIRSYLILKQFSVDQWEQECLDVIMHSTNEKAYEVGSLLQEDEGYVGYEEYGEY